MSTSWAILTYELSKTFPPAFSWRRLLARRPAAPIAAVDAVNLAVRRGELFGLLGPNGAGKTTLIKMLTTLVLPSGGAAWVNGYPLRQEALVRGSLGLATSDERSFFWRLSGRQNLEFFARLNGLNRAEARAAAEWGLEQTALSEHGGQSFANYSTGMRQRLAIARALLGRPALLFLDEPTKGLDPTAARQVQQLIRRDLVERQGITVFLTTHDLREAQLLCDRLAVMHHGRILALGSVPELRRELGDIERYRLWVDPLPQPDAARLALSLPAARYQGAENRPEPADGAAQIEFETQAGAQRLNQAIDLARAAGSRIRRIEVEQLSLETIFERLTGAEAPALRALPPMPAPPTQAPGEPPAGGPQRRVTLLQTAAAFIRRDFQIETSYRFAVLLQLFGVLFTVSVFFFLSQLLGDAILPYLEAYGGDYFAFVVIGIAFAGYFNFGITAFADRLRGAQTTGTLEAMLSTPASLAQILVSSALWDFLLVTLRVLAYLAVGAGLLGMPLNAGSLPAALLLLGLTVVVFSSLGILAAAFIMALKRGDPITWSFSAISTLLGGVYFPVSVLPEPLAWVARLLPITYALEGMRKALLQNASFAELLPEIGALFLFAVVLVPAGWLGFRYAVRRAKTDGSLTHY